MNFEFFGFNLVLGFDFCGDVVFLVEFCGSSHWISLILLLIRDGKFWGFFFFFKFEIFVLNLDLGWVIIG